MHDKVYIGGGADIRQGVAHNETEEIIPDNVQFKAQYNPVDKYWEIKTNKETFKINR
ncbi:MAG: hypothetical protein Q8903_08425 [Bacteroidota bacterium]|nr:hypothetical protein [Bacteroidota bacterium]